VKPRCGWARGEPLLESYHDEEWGVPVLDSISLWQSLAIIGFQAGLSWITILRKRDALRAAFGGLAPRAVAGYGARDLARLMRDPRVIRSRPKLAATMGNARAFEKMAAEGEDLASIVWSAVEGMPIMSDGAQVASSPLSELIASTLKSRGYKFAGPVIVQAWLREIGAVNDHEPHCYRRDEVRELAPIGSAALGVIDQPG